MYSWRASTQTKVESVLCHTRQNMTLEVIQNHYSNLMWLILKAVAGSLDGITQAAHMPYHTPTQHDSSCTHSCMQHLVTILWTRLEGWRHHEMDKQITCSALVLTSL